MIKEAASQSAVFFVLKFGLWNFVWDLDLGIWDLRALFAV
jgi:hypothetical protein